MPESQLVTAEELRAKAGAVLLLDARVGPDGRAAYEREHLSGAIWVDLETDLAAPRADAADGGRHPLPVIADWCRRLGAWGIGPETEVVVYDDRGGALAAARAWWMLRAVGHRRVSLLDGGWPAALAAELETTSDLPELEPRSPYPEPEASWTLPTIDAEQVEEWRFDGSTVLLDARSPVRYRGESESLDPVAGHIPGAANLHYEIGLDDDGRFLAPEELERRFAPVVGDHEGGSLAAYCGSGVTACHLLFALERAGLQGAALYVGSWSEWCRSQRPRASVVTDTSLG